LELTTFLWLKDHKRFADLPTLKLIEAARLSLEPTEQIYNEFIKRVEIIKNKNKIDEGVAAGFRQFVYIRKEELMQHIGANPEYIEIMELPDLERMYDPRLGQTYDIKARLFLETENEVQKAGRYAKKISKYGIYTTLAILFGLLLLCTHMDIRVSISSAITGLIGLIDAVYTRAHFIDRLSTVIANKLEERVRRYKTDYNKRIIGEVQTKVWGGHEGI
jgi:hypothetical protein